MTMTPEQLKRIRARMNMTQKQLAGALGVWQETVARWEIGSRRIPEPTARLIKCIEKEVVTPIEAAERKRAERAETDLFLQLFRAGVRGGRGGKGKKRGKGTKRGVR